MGVLRTATHERKLKGANTILVGPGLTHETVQAGIDAAAAGDTIRMSPGTFTITSTLTIPNGVRVEGCGVLTEIQRTGTFTTRAAARAIVLGTNSVLSNVYVNNTIEQTASDGGTAVFAGAGAVVEFCKLVASHWAVVLDGDNAIARYNELQASNPIWIGYGPTYRTGCVADCNKISWSGTYGGQCFAPIDSLYSRNTRMVGNYGTLTVACDGATLTPYAIRTSDNNNYIADNNFVQTLTGSVAYSAIYSGVLIVHDSTQTATDAPTRVKGNRVLARLQGSETTAGVHMQAWLDASSNPAPIFESNEIKIESAGTTKTYSIVSHDENVTTLTTGARNATLKQSGLRGGYPLCMTDLGGVTWSNPLPPESFYVGSLTAGATATIKGTVRTGTRRAYRLTVSGVAANSGGNLKAILTKGASTATGLHAQTATTTGAVSASDTGLIYEWDIAAQYRVGDTAAFNVEGVKYFALCASEPPIGTSVVDEGGDAYWTVYEDFTGLPAIAGHDFELNDAFSIAVTATTQNYTDVVVTLEWRDTD